MYQYRNQLHGILFVLIAGILWGTVGIATKAIYQQSEINAVTVGFFRLAIAFPFVCISCLFFLKKRELKGDLPSYLKMFLIGIMLALYQVLYFASIDYVGVSIATLVTLCTAPVIVSLSSVFILKEPLTWRISASLVCAMAGTVFIVGFPGNFERDANVIIGVSLALGSAVGYAIVAMLGRSLSKKCHPLYSTAVSFGVGALFLLPFSSLGGIPTEYSKEILSLLLYIGIIPSALAYSMFFLGMRHILASMASILTMTEPLTATLLAWLIYDEKLKWPGYVGAVLLLLAITVLCGRRKAENHKMLQKDIIQAKY